MVISLSGAALSYYSGNWDRFGHDHNTLQTVLFGVMERHWIVLFGALSS
jgi:hypothetical protein